MTSLAALAAAPRRRLWWAANMGMTAGSTALWGTPMGSLTGGLGDVPFSVTASAGEVPTSYPFGELTVSGLTNDAAIVGLEFFGLLARHRTALLDLLWISAGYTSTAAATVNSPTLPARDVNDSTNGEGCVLVAWFASAMNATISYTNAAGVAGRTATLPANIGGGPHIFPLQDGDRGVSSVQTITPSSTALCRFAIVRRVASASTRFGTNVAFPRDHATSRFHNLHTLKAGALLYPEFGMMGTSLVREVGCYVDLALQ